MLSLGSLFDGIGGFPLAAARNGIVPLWASEVEPFPITVTKIRFPGMAHVGDITKLDGAKLPPVDIICGGSPCQDLSVAGRRKGLAGERSGLFMDQVRIVKEMRGADGQRGLPDYLVRPRYLVWENVPGAFSSAKGEDFRAVIEEIVRVKAGACHVPRPDSGGWGPAGAAILGDEFSLAWRVLDAQFWGVAQRRRRIFLVADFGGRTAPEILFKQGSLPWDTSEGQGTGDGTPAGAERGFGGAGAPGCQGVGGCIPVICLNDQGGERMNLTVDITGTLRAGMSGHQPLVLENGGGWRYGKRKEPGKKEPENDGAPPESRESFCISGNIIGRETKNGGNGFGCQRDIAYTLTGMDRHAVFVCGAKKKGAGHMDMGRGSAGPCVNSGRRADGKRGMVRRITPLECERLQGFPDGWTDVPGASDSSRYKALGNSVAIPCVDYVLRGIAFFLKRAEPGNGGGG